MQDPSSSVHVFDTHAQVEEAIQALARAGLDMKKLSLIGKGYHRESLPIGFHASGDRIEAWGIRGTFLGGIWGMLRGPAFFLLPGVGLVAMAGPVVAMLVCALEARVAAGGRSALGQALARFGLARAQAMACETELKLDKYVLLVHGNAIEVGKVATVAPQAEAWLAAA